PTRRAAALQNMRYETENPELLELANQIQEQTRRVTRIVQSLMKFAHAGHHSIEHEPVNLAHIINEAMQLLRLSKRSQDIQFENLCHDSLYLLGDAQRLLQVYVILLSNDRDDSHPGPTIRVYAEADKHQLVVRVVDEGHGVPAYKLDRNFEPVFTTSDE